MLETLSCDYNPSASVYFAVTDGTLNYCDFADDTFKPLSHNTLVSAVSGGAGSCSFTVSGNCLASLTVGKKIRVRGSTGGTDDGVYTIRSGSSYSAPNTTINVSEAVAGSTSAGTLDLNATPYVAGTEHTNAAGSGVSRYLASIDLNLINPTTTLSQYNVQAFAPAGSAPVPDSDTAVSSAAGLDIQLGLLGPQEIRAKLQIGITSTAGTTCQLSAWLEVNGQVVNLASVDPSATASAIVVQFGQTSGGSPAFSVSTDNFGSPTTDNRFEYTKTFAGFNADQQYSAIVTLTVNGNAFVVDEPFPVFA